MKLNWKIVLPTVIVVAVAIILFSQSGGNDQNSTAQNGNTDTSGAMGEQASLPPATGNVNDAINAIIASATNEASDISSDTNDASLVTSDTATLNGFGQTYDENSF